MKRGGLVLVAILVAAGAFRMGSPTGTGTPEGSGQAALPNQARKAAKPPSLSPEIDALKRAAYSERLKGTIQSFFGSGCETANAGELHAHWSVPKKLRTRVRFLIAIFPDPKHTRLGLFFDRGIEAIQQAAQSTGFDFDRAIMPWSTNEAIGDADIFSRLLQSEIEVDNERYPGLLIFRQGLERLGANRGTGGPEPLEGKNCSGDPSSDRAPLFVLLVGEKPTGGIDKEQFSQALKMIGDIRSGEKNQDLEPPLFILGPTSSGSFYSLEEAIHINLERLPKRGVFVFSGIARATGPRRWFVGSKPKMVRYLSTQENEGDLLRQFAKFVRDDLSIENSDVVVLSEDETSYGRTETKASYRPKPQADEADCPDKVSKDQDPCPESAWTAMQFPRSISQFRSAYQKEFGSSGAEPEVVAPGRAVLRLDLESHGEDDSVPIYAKDQIPMSQEAVMLQIIAALRQRSPAAKLVVLRATDPLDQLFLARYLRTHYPEGRIVVVEPDLLLARDQDGLLTGTTTVSSYPLVLREQAVLYRTFEEGGNPMGSTAGLDRIFASASGAGTFNATIALLQESDRCQNSPDWCARDLHGTGIIAGPYSGYGTPYFATYKRGRSNALNPGFWVSTLGRDGFWAVHAAEGDADSTLEAIKTKATAPSVAKSIPDPATTNSITPKVQFSRPTKAWRAAYFLFLMLLLAHTVMLWKGSILSRFEPLAIYGVVESSPPFGSQEDFNDRKRRATTLALGTLFLSTGLLFLECVWLGTRQPDDKWTDNLLKFAAYLSYPILLVGMSIVAIWIRHGEKRIASVTAFVFLLFLGFTLFPRTWFPGTESLLVTRRILALTSGVSPVLPVLYFLLMGTCAVWYELRGMALVDIRRPRLPAGTKNNELDRMNQEQGEKILAAMRPFEVEWSVLIPSVLLVLVLMVTAMATMGFDALRPLQTLEGPLFDHIYGVLLWAGILLFTGCTFKFAATWMECRVLLSALDRVPLRDAFKRLKEFTWGPLWSVGGAALRDSFKLVARQLECLGHLEAGMEDRARLPQESYLAVHDQIVYTKKRRAVVTAYYEEAKKDSRRIPPLMEAYALLQEEMARLTSLLHQHVLVPMWSLDELPVTSAFPKKMAHDRSEFELVAEEYVSLTYANFLVTVLLRMRTMVVCAIAMYVFLLLSFSSYPFSPSSSLFAVAVLLILMLGLVVGVVYAQMHREATLSRLTDTTEGELGVNFWLEFASAGALPVLTLLGSQFPQISQIVYSLLKPLLQSVK